MTEERKYTTEELRQKYYENCKLQKQPIDTPAVCWHCGGEIYQYHAKHIMQGYCGITGCPHCSRTYID